MCGITGVMALDGTLDPRFRDALPAMTAAIRHRGPDSGGAFVDQSVALGHRRLCIIDVATGAQPIPNEDRTRWIVFNGEIYNHHDLRADLAGRGHVFNTASDTEAVLHAYEEYGEGCVERLEGMFAIAIYDSTRRELFLARDRLGKKPLFYGVFGGALHFASEMKCFRHSPVWDGTLDLTTLEAYFSLGYFLAPGTVYRHVRKLEPGHWLRASRGRIEIRQYWDVTEFDTDQRAEARVLEELDPLLAKAVTDRLESEVPLGAFLSGGIDSGLVVSYMAGTGRDVVTASVGFGGDTRNELATAGTTAAYFRTRHYPHMLEARLDDVLTPIVTAFDEPFADSSAIPTWYVSKAAREHVTVALSGDGGDETFAGYDFRYVPHALEGAARRFIPATGGRAALRWLGSRWPQSPRLPKALRLSTIFENLAGDAADAYYLDLCALKPGRTRRLLGAGGRDPRDSPVYEAVTAPYRRCPSPSVVQKAQYADLKVYMPNDPLVKVDRMAMQHALEVRCPLLDRRVVEFAFRLPTRMKMARLRGKHLLRALAAKRLPARVAGLPKLGFNAPVATWLAGPYRHVLAEDLFAAGASISSVVDTRHLRELYDEHVRGEADHWYPLWACWVFERWAQQEGGGGLCPS